MKITKEVIAQVMELSNNPIHTELPIEWDFTLADFGFKYDDVCKSFVLDLPTDEGDHDIIIVEMPKNDAFNELSATVRAFSYYVQESVSFETFEADLVVLTAWLRKNALCRMTDAPTIFFEAKYERFKSEH